MATSPVFEAVPRVERGVLSAANTNRDGSGTVVTLLTAVAAGTEIKRVVVTATGTTTAGMVRLFLYDGTNYTAIREIPIGAVTPSASLAAARGEVVFSDIMLPNASWSLRASTHNAETFHVVVLGADLT